MDVPRKDAVRGRVDGEGTPLRRSREFLNGLLVALVFMVPPWSAASQVVEGRVMDADTEEGVVGVTVTLLDLDESVMLSVLTDSRGDFRVSTPHPGRFRLSVTRIGYEEITSAPLDVRDSEVVEVELRISTAPVALEPLTVVSDRPPLVLDSWLVRHGFYERRQRFGSHGMNSGQFLDRDEILARNPFRVTDVLRTMRNVHVRPSGVTGPGVRFSLESTVTIRRGCEPTVYLNGVRQRRDFDVFPHISPSHLVGIEVYTGPPFPARYYDWPPDRQTALCGVIVLWTG